MNLSRKWLGEFVDVDANDKDFAEIMTMAGSKVETYARLDAEIKNVVVGKVLSMVRHENSDHMWVCQVDVGRGEPVQIVTGAQNVHEGDLVPAALHNSYLPGGVHITKGKLRGVASNGMLCSLKELNLTLNDFPYAIEDGIWILQEDCTVGQDINEVIGNDDTVVEFEITNNRPDCFSLIGLAREAAAAFNRPMRHHEPVVQGGGPGVLPELLDVEVPAADLCSRYTARMVRNVKIAPSPKWMRERLRSAGVRPINNIVDITNYVMIEYGQPMHAFDYRYVKGGKIIVRRAEAGETLTTLDGNVRPLQPGMLVIADETRPVGLAGIMGGENSEIVDDTVDVVFESANFNGTSIRQTALALGMRTEASAKFEKNLDPLNTLPAVDRACELVELLGAGEVLNGVIDILNFVPQPVVLPLETDKINRLLGLEIPEAEMVEYLRRLEIPVENGMVQVPSWRSDLKCMADIAEEVARLYGYNRIPTTLPHGATTLGGYSAGATLAQKAGIVARGLGYSEILTYSFDSPKMFDAIRLPADSPLRETVKILNPLGEDTSVMRTTALPAMLETLQRNVAYHNKAAKFYEVATIYLPQPGQVLPNEPKILSLGAYGAGVTFFTLKGEIESLLQCLGIQEAEYTPVTDDPSFHPGRCARLTIAGQDMGIFGQIHPLVAQNYDMDCEVYAAQLNFTGFMSVRKPDCVYCPLPKYPTVSRDLALVCDEDKTVGCVEKCIASAGGKLLKSVRLFDVYRGPGIPEGKKSLAFSLELRADDRTLTDEDSAAVVQKILAKLDQDLGVKLR